MNDDTDMQSIKKALETKLEALLARAEDLEAVLSDPGNKDSEENATEMENDEAMLEIGDVTRREIRDIRLALERIDAGTYGACVECGAPIGADRLEMLPFTPTCIHCA